MIGFGKVTRPFMCLPELLLYSQNLALGLYSGLASSIKWRGLSWAVIDMKSPLDRCGLSQLLLTFPMAFRLHDVSQEKSIIKK